MSANIVPNMTVGDEAKLDYLIKTHNEVRSEIQMRIAQRDTFAIQFVVATGAVFTLGFLDFSYAPFLFFLLPAVAIFYTVQIFYSYKIHDRCHAFLVKNIEPAIAGILGFDGIMIKSLMWENYCQNAQDKSKERNEKNPGIRKGFFVKISYIMPIVSGLLFTFVSTMQAIINHYIVVLISFIIGGGFLLFNCRILRSFKNKE